MDAGGRYAYVKPAEREKVEHGLAQMQALFDKAGSVDAMGDGDRIALFNAQESVNAVSSCATATASSASAARCRALASSRRHAGPTARSRRSAKRAASSCRRRSPGRASPSRARAAERRDRPGRAERGRFAIAIAMARAARAGRVRWGFPACFRVRAKTRAARAAPEVDP
ncbi:MAG TPA: hypothetical protein VFS55_07305 [Dokdonella sp.]|nr:hypothetical protein [Dokdonella sp.]